LSYKNNFFYHHFGVIFIFLQGKGREFIEIYRGTKKQFMINKLTPATFYGFRLAAENSIGRR